MTTTTLPTIPVTVGGFVFVQDPANGSQWNANGPDGERLFELSVQKDPDGEDDWGIWDVAGDEWAHWPLTTGFCTKEEAVSSFLAWLKENN